MASEEPMLTGRNSLKRILWAVEQSISKEKGFTGMNPPPFGWGTPSKDDAERTASASAGTDATANANANPDPPLPSRTLPTNQQAPMGFPSDQAQQPLRHFPNDASAFGFHPEEQGGIADPLFNFNLDIMTTDLSNFFPINIMTPGDSSLDLGYQSYNQ